MRKVSNYALDETLRSVLPSLWSKGEITTVAIEFTYRGETYRVDTPEEVTTLKAHLAKRSKTFGSIATMLKSWR